MTAEPRYATRPTPGALHDAGSIAKVAGALGTPLMPWQHAMNRVATERDPGDPQRFRYQLVVVSVPRQSGKTTGVRAVLVERTMRRPNHLAFYTAQTGKDARERWRDLIKQVDASPLAPFAQVRYGAGAETLAWPNGSELRAFAPTPSSLHGYTPGTVAVDEPWAFSEDEGESLMAAIDPAQITLVDRQLWLFSTMGDASSTWWHEIAVSGRDATKDPNSRMCYIEYSAEPGSDLYDPANWRRFHPALGYTITEHDLAAAAERVSPSNWSRSYCNLATVARRSLLDPGVFEALGNTELRREGQPWVLTYDVAHDLSDAAIAAVWLGPDGTPCVRVLLHAPGVSWLADQVVALARDERPPLGVSADDGGPAREVTDAVRRRGVDVLTLTAVQYATGSGAWLRRARDGQLRHDGSAPITSAMAGAVLRTMGDGVAFSRRHSSGSIAALVAGVVGLSRVVNAPEPAPAPMIRVPA